ncbi:hypothetical protein EVA_06902 [gut metagenome]|uniref:Uncharacterized protein n=1 Tax=gut metagenome TaxID=749906 RepID=J9CXJ6_9ZZZZ
MAQRLKRKCTSPLRNVCLRWMKILKRACRSVLLLLWLWVTLTTARPAFWTPSVPPMLLRARQAELPSTSVPIRLKPMASA